MTSTGALYDRIESSEGVFMNLPNKITLTRICLIPVFAVFYCLDAIPYHYLIAGVIFSLAACTDFLDGHIARKRNLVTNLGKFLDPIADKVLVSTALILLLAVPAAYGTGYLAGWGSLCAGIFTAVILGRELIVSGFRMVAAERKIVLAADIYGKLKTVAQDVALAVLIVASSFAEMEAGKIAIVVGFSVLALATALTVLSGLNYIIGNRQVLREED